jgi:hypothetical protein
LKKSEDAVFDILANIWVISMTRLYEHIYHLHPA